MRTVGAREANQQFSRILREVEGGKKVTITKSGKAVAHMIPARPPRHSPARKKAIEEMVRLMEKGFDLGGRPFTRDEMHED